MKKKVKKFGRGGDILTGLGAGLLGYALYNKLKGDKGDEEEKPKAVDTKGRTPLEQIEAQTGRKAEKQRVITDYMTNKPEEKKGGYTTPVKEYEPEPPKPSKLPKPAGGGSRRAEAAPAAKEDRAKEKVGKGYENIGKTTPKSVAFKPAEETKQAESPVKLGSPGSYKFDSKPDLSTPKGFDMRGTNKTVYGTDTTSVFQKKAAQERAEAEEKAKKKAREQANIRSGESERMMREALGSGYKRGGAVKKYASGGSVSSASKRADGIAQRGKTRGRVL